MTTIMTSAPILELPVEILCMIVGHIDLVDVGNLARAHPFLSRVINEGDSPIWRVFFTRRFDGAGHRDSAFLKRLLLHRETLLSKKTLFTNGFALSEQACIELLKDLIVESYHSNTVRAKHIPLQRSQSLATLKTYCKFNDFFRDFMLGKHQLSAINPLMQVVQVALAHLVFDPEIVAPSRNLPESQYVVYSSALTEPLFMGSQRSRINFKWLASVINMFKYYLRFDKIENIFRSYQALKATERPQVWSSTLDASGAIKLGRHWKGCYSYLDMSDVRYVRNQSPLSYNEFLDDEFNDGGDDFSELILVHPDDTAYWPFPESFEKVLRCKTHPSTVHLQRLRDETLRQESVADREHRSPTGPRDELPAASHGLSPRALEYCTGKSLRDNDNLAKGLREQDIDPTPLPFKAAGLESDPFLSAGYLSPMPHQFGIPGFMRFTMIKYFHPPEIRNDRVRPALNQFEALKKILANHEAFAATLITLDPSDDLWVYEGVVLPGGKIIIGRWWATDELDHGDGIGIIDDQDRAAPASHLYSGPFMYWNVDHDDGCKGA